MNPAGTWERNGSLFESDCYVIAAMLAHKYDNSAISQSRSYTKDTVKKVMKDLQKMFPSHRFTVNGVALYIDGSANDNAHIQKNSKRRENYRKQLKILRSVIQG